MGQIAETSTFDATVYQWEVSDNVTGGPDGIAVAPIKSLTNRTRFLNDAVTLLNTQIAKLAPLNGPVFTGTPTTPTPDASAAGLQIVNAAWVRGVAGGFVSVPITANYNLSGVQAGNATYYVNGNTNAATFLFFPDALVGRWTVINDTPNALIVRHAGGGNSVQIATRRTQTVFSDGSNVGQCHNDYDSVSLTGTPTAPTPPVKDSSTLIPNTSWTTAAIAAEAALRDAADTKIRTDVAGSYATIAQLTAETNARTKGDNDEAAARDAADTGVKGYVAGNFCKRANVAQTSRSNFIPGDATDSKTGISFTSSDQGGTLLIDASANITGTQQPGNAYLRILINNTVYFEEYTNGPMSAMVGIAVGANTTFLVQAQYLTTNIGGGAWKQTGLNLALHFVSG